MLTSFLKSLAELRDSYKFSYNSQLEHAVGAAVRSMGPEAVLNVITLKVIALLFKIHVRLINLVIYFSIAMVI